MEAPHYRVRDQSIINILGRNHIYKMEIYLLHFLKHLTTFVDLVYRCGLEKRNVHFDLFFSMKWSSLVGYPPSGAKNW